MSPNPNLQPETDVKTLLALRQAPDALRLITEKLRVKDMGPADHIRTKHEVKLFVESGNWTAAESLLKNVRDRHAAQQVAEQVSQRQGQRMGQ